MRPDNLLLDAAERVKLCDFGRTVTEGTRIPVATYPFYRPNDDATAGPSHEQFAIGSCAYTIRTGEMPYGEWETPADFQAIHDALVRGDFPKTDDDRVLGQVVMDCWLARYSRMKDVEEAIAQAVGPLCEDESDFAPSPDDHDTLVRYCRDFVSRHQSVPDGMVRA